MITYKGKTYDAIIEQYDNSRGNANPGGGIYQHIWTNYMPFTGKWDWLGREIFYKDFDCMEVKTESGSIDIHVVALFKVKLK